MLSYPLRGLALSHQETTSVLVNEPNSQVREGTEVRSTLEEACSQEYPESAFCVRRFDDSLNSAIRTTYRISLRSSSLPEPRYPLLRVVQYSVKSGLQRDGF